MIFLKLNETVFKKVKTDLLVFLTLIPIVIVLQHFILKPHLQYGFADIDWQYRLFFKQLSALYHDPISHILNAWRGSGAYTYQVYYIGLIEYFFGFDYQTFNLVTHFFKMIATLSLYPLVLFVTKRRLVAFLSTIIYAVSYSSVGAIYTVITSGLYVAITGMCVFLCWYWFIVKNNRDGIKDILLAILLFLIAFILTTERMYPLVAVIILVEFFWCFKNDFSTTIVKKVLKRLSVFSLLFLAVFLFKPGIFTIFFGNTPVIIGKISDGNWQVLMSPFVSLGSLFIDKEHWIIFGVPNISDLFSYLSFLIVRPLIIFSFLTVFLSIFISRKPIKFILFTLSTMTIFSFIAYFAANHHLTILETKRMHYDASVFVPALIGGYVLSLCFALFQEWKANLKQDTLMISMVGGIVISFIFILMTWIFADWVLIFYGVHRYLTVPAIGSSLFVAGFMALIFDRLYLYKLTRPLSCAVFLFLGFYIVYNVSIIDNYFKSELNFTGTGAAGQTRMKDRLWSYLNNFSETEPSIFYFDESVDYKNGYFDETTILAGFNYWMRFRGREIVDAKLTPSLIRSNLVCQEERSTCLSKVNEFVTIKNGVKGILYGDMFYRPENFYAFRFLNRDIVDIRPEVVKIIGLE